MNESDKCCFCGTVLGALIRLHQGWCCIRCFRGLENIDRMHEARESIGIKGRE